MWTFCISIPIQRKRILITVQYPVACLCSILLNENLLICKLNFLKQLIFARHKLKKTFFLPINMLKCLVFGCVFRKIVTIQKFLCCVIQYSTFYCITCNYKNVGKLHTNNHCTESNSVRNLNWELPEIIS